MNENLDKYGAPNFGCLVGTAYQTLLGELADALKKSGVAISTSEYMILRALYNKDGIQQFELAAILGKDQSAICRSVASMEKKGLIRTEAISYKCRRVFLSLKGINLRESVMQVAHVRQQSLESILSSDEIKSLESSLLKIINHA